MQKIEATLSGYVPKMLNRRERIVFLGLYTSLLALWGTVFFSHYGLSLYAKNFQVPLTMVFGSFLGGFTCEGGGAVAFPVFTKVLHIEPYVARDFSFAIQSIGMSFASITVLLRKIKIEKNVIKFAVIGGLVGIVIGSYTIVPYISASQTKLVFTLVITSFGVALFLKNFVFKSWEHERIIHFKLMDAALIFTIGIMGGLFSSIIGTGIHFITFSFVTLLYRLDEKVATPTSVMIMAADSIFGFTFRLFVLNQFSGQALQYWALSIPVAAFFAPLGAIVCSKVSRIFIVKMLLVLIGIEFITTLFIFKFQAETILLSVLVIALSLLVYILMVVKFSKRFAGEEMVRQGINAGV
ncbi:sulfite exporter TauE/SafE family protein [Desulfotomaculum copahuensis]|uniref:Probable membrane transporter protein n=1 Tax=Desulfotomaculum copahuensis TaxID=1838280 RepID=A0A1B7LFX1_9FIRM|nr:sulfite exporter TauE/SafE family protein [Desulfotomaculum copahuensis]OAT83627.1 hypothetical protein A6M21_08055 [Desulfotomaculum copahuensis]